MANSENGKEELVRRYREGDRAAGDELVEAMKPQISAIIRSIGIGRAIDYDDVLSAAYVGLVDAINNYDSSRGKFSNYVQRRIRGEILDELRRTRGRGLSGCMRNEFKVNICSLDAPSKEGEDPLLEIIGEYPDIRRRIFDVQIEEFARTCLEEASKEMGVIHEKNILGLLIEGHSQSEIGRMLGVSPTAINVPFRKFMERHKEHSSVKKLREELYF